MLWMSGGQTRVESRFSDLKTPWKGTEGHMAGAQWSLAGKELVLGSLVSQPAPTLLDSAWFLVYLVLRRQHVEASELFGTSLINPYICPRHFLLASSGCCVYGCGEVVTLENLA